MRAFLFFLLAIISMPLISQTEAPSDTVVIGNGVFEKVDVEATFSGGEAAWRKYLEQNLDPNVPVENGAPIGIYTVVVQFIVDKTGAVSDIKTLTNFGYGMEQEVIRIMKKSPVWTPASQNNITVKAYRKQPVTFVIEAEDVDIIMNEKYILYTGKENMITVDVAKVKDENLELSLSQGSVTPMGNGVYKIKVNNPGKSILTIGNRKRNKPIGEVYFVVKAKSPPGKN